MGLPRVSISSINATPNTSWFGLKTGGKTRQRMLFVDRPDDTSNGIGVETKKPLFSCFYEPLEVGTSRGKQTVWVDRTSFKKRDATAYNKYCNRPKTVNPPFEQQSPEKHSDETRALWRKINEFTRNPPSLQELDRLRKYAIQPGTQGVKVESGNRGRTLVVSPKGDYFVCLTRSGSQCDIVVKTGTRKRVKIAINRNNLEERIVATGKKRLAPEYRKEIQILEKLQGDEEFVQIDTWAETADKYYIIMEKCAGSLWDKIRGVKEPLTLALDYARGVQKLHQKNIVHRDIKPHNLLISEQGRGKICDFGDSADGKSEFGYGTSNFSWDPTMVKEKQLDKRLDRRMDIWALGGSLYFLFHPTHDLLPYQNMGDFPAKKALRELTQDQIDSTIDHSGIADPKVRKLLKGMLTVDRAKRLDAAQVVKALEEIKRGPVWKRALGYLKSTRFFSRFFHYLDRVAAGQPCRERRQTMLSGG